MSGLWTWDPGTDVVTWSASVAPLYGVPEPAATYQDQLAACHPDDRKRLDREWLRMVETGVPARQVYRSVSGAPLSSQAQLIQVQGRPFVVGSVRAAARAHSDERRFAELFRSFPVGVALLTDEGFFVEVNEAFCALVGQTRPDLVGTPFLRLIHPDEVQAALETRQQIGRASPLVRVERRLVRADGSVIWGLINTRRYEEGGAAFQVVAVEDITARKQAEDQLVVLALHDSLTGLPNRRLLLDRLEQALARSRRNGRDVAVLFLDLDHVKQVNDTLGHEAGDELLIAVAKSLQAAVRGSDTVARLGGDEFVVVCEQSGGLPELESLAERLLEAVRTPVAIGSETVTVTASIGLVTPTSVTDRPQDLLRAADDAMYQAKQAGRGRVVIGAARIEPAVTELLRLETEVRAGLERGEFVLHYQPVVRMDGEILSVEALLRWRHPERGLLLPDEFLPRLAGSTVSGPLTVWVLDRALSDASTWGGDGSDGLAVSVNVSVDRLRDPAFVGEVLELLERHAFAAGSLSLEVLEDELADTASVSDVVVSLHEAGVRFAVDDFGTGYSSLAYLKRLPIEVVKIDRSFVASIAHDAADRSIVQAVLEACRATGRTTVAEGVEHSEQLDVLRALGCDAVQGAITTMPLPHELLAPLVASRRVDLPVSEAQASSQA